MCIWWLVSHQIMIVRSFISLIVDEIDPNRNVPVQEDAVDEHGHVTLATRQIFDRRINSEKRRVRIKCKGDGCQWHVHASPAPDMHGYMIKTLMNTHTCHSVEKNKDATSTWIANKIEWKANPDIKISALRDELKETYGINVSDLRLYRAQKKAKEDHEGNHGASFWKLRQYAHMVRHTNRGSDAILDCRIVDPESPPMFKRFFMCLDATKQGFIQGCRPFIWMDGCHLKGPYGCVYSAIALDANLPICPIAWQL